MELVWQRQAIFAGALSLAAYYYSVTLAILCMVLISISETYDFFVFRRILRHRRFSEHQLKQYMWLLTFGTILSSSVIVLYSVGLAYVQGPDTHFMPLFLLFAAAVFAAMNNHQILRILKIRVGIYGLAFAFIPIRDVVITGASIDSELWAQLFSSLFVLYFIIECARNFLALYQKNLMHLEHLRLEVAKSKQAYKAKTEFVSTMSHELRTPLTSIKGSVDIIKTGALGQLPEKVDETLTLTQRNCNRLLELITGVLDLQKIDSGKLKLNMEIVDVSEVLKASLIANEQLAQSNQTVMSATLPSLPMFVRSDKKRLVQVIESLLSNATKFSPKGSTVKIWAETQDDDVIVNVSDEGVGLDEKDAKIVFGAFSQLDSSDSRSFGGVGMGLNIAKKLVSELGGQIGYAKNADRGTTFFIRFAQAPA